MTPDLWKGITENQSGYGMVGCLLLAATGFTSVLGRGMSETDLVAVADQSQVVIAGISGSMEHRDIWLVNTAARDLEVGSINMSCSCVDAQMAPPSVPAGARARLRVQVHLPPGRSTQWIALRFHNEDAATLIRLETVGVYAAGLTVAPRELFWDDVCASDTIHLSLYWRGADPSPTLGHPRLASGHATIPGEFSGWSKGSRPNEVVGVLRVSSEVLQGLESPLIVTVGSDPASASAIVPVRH